MTRPISIDEALAQRRTYDAHNQRVPQPRIGWLLIALPFLFLFAVNLCSALAARNSVALLVGDSGQCADAEDFRTLAAGRAGSRIPEAGGELTDF